MKTSKEMQLKILNKMIENIENDNDLLKDIQYRNAVTLEWDNRLYDIGQNHFKSLEMRVKPETIMLSSVEIPKPLEHRDVASHNIYYFAVNGRPYWGRKTGAEIASDSIRFIYETKEEAIEASKLLFGIKQ